MHKLFLFFSALCLFSCGSQTPVEQAITAPDSTSVIHLTGAQLKNSGLVTGYAEEKPVSAVLKVNGQIEVPPQNLVSVSIPLGGYLRSTHLLPGMRVKKGEVIATVEDQQYIQIQQDYLTAVAELAFTEADYNRQKALNENKASSDKLFQQTEAGYKTALIRVRSLHEKLKLIGINPAALNEQTLSRSVHITAPIDGYVANANVNTGKYVNPSEVLFELVDPSDIHLTLRIFEKDLDKIRVGDQVEAYSNAHPEKKYGCRIILTGRTFSADRSVEVHAHFEQDDPGLIPGMYMNALIHTHADTSLVVPESAVVNYEGKSFVFLDRGESNYELTEVTTGYSAEGYTAIGPLKETRPKIVLQGAYPLLMMMMNTSE